MPTQAVNESAGSLKSDLARHREAMLARLAFNEDGIALARTHAAYIRSVLENLFAEAARGLGDGANSLALAAVGSFGRGALALYSDADVRILVGADAQAESIVETFSEKLFYPLWDSTLAVGHQILDTRDIIELAQKDLATATSLLDLSYVAGNRKILGELLDRAWTGLFAEGELASFVERLENDAGTRHEKFGGSVYLLEPDVKSGPGGLRDLDSARWAVRARFRTSEDPAAGATWNELVRLGVLVPREATQIANAEQFLWRVRNRLHAHAGRRADRLTFDEQESVAIELGYGAEPSTDGSTEADPNRDRARAAEAFMQDYYRHARVVTAWRERLLERATPPKRRPRPIEVDIGRGVRLFDGHVSIAGSADLADDPALAFRVYSACVRHGAPVFPFARETITRAANDPEWCEKLRADTEARDRFVELICTVPEVRTRRGSMPAELHDVGLLLAMVPEFAPVTGRVHHDVYHVYTVDVHSVAALDCLRALCRGELAQQYPLACRLAAEIARPRPLFLATLLHDVGKGYPDSTGSRKNHSVSGAELCQKILARLGFGADEIEEARMLVLSHLAMYHTATRRDLDDPASIEEFSRQVRGREGLRDLFLLTVADISTTSPTAMNTWKARMLDELYFVTDQFLLGTNERGVERERLQRIRECAASLWSGDPTFLEQFIASMPERYLLANSPEAIAAHAGVALDRGSQLVHAAVVPSRHADVAELCVVAEDKPGLLSRIAAAITAGRLEVLAAQVYSRKHPANETTEAVDLFWVRDRVDGAEGVARALPRFVRDLVSVCDGSMHPEELLRTRTGSVSPWRERPTPKVITEVFVDDRASPKHTVIEIFAKDRPGLLYRVAHTLHQLGLSIASSKINTEGTKVADVFYVSELDGSKAKPGERFKTIREVLMQAIGE